MQWKMLRLLYSRAEYIYKVVFTTKSNLSGLGYGHEPSDMNLLELLFRTNKNRGSNGPNPNALCTLILTHLGLQDKYVHSELGYFREERIILAQGRVWKTEKDNTSFELNYWNGFSPRKTTEFKLLSVRPPKKRTLKGLRQHTGYMWAFSFQTWLGIWGHMLLPGIPPNCGQAGWFCPAPQ